jgi:hypothetical protein
VQHDDWRPDVDVASPDGCVRLRASVDGQIGVRVQNLHRHSEQSLERQVGAVARVALAALQQMASAEDRSRADEPLRGSS